MRDKGDVRGVEEQVTWSISLEHVHSVVFQLENGALPRSSVNSASRRFEEHETPSFTKCIFSPNFSENVEPTLI